MKNKAAKSPPFNFNGYLVLIILILAGFVPDWYNANNILRNLAIVTIAFITSLAIYTGFTSKYKANELLVKIKPYLKSKFTHKMWIYSAIGSLILVSIITCLYLLGATKTKLSINQIYYMLVLAPILEECVYRHFLFNWLLKFNVAIAFILEIVLFTLIHLPNSFLGMLSNLIGAIVLTSVYYFSDRNLLASLFVHVANNLAIVIIMFM